MRPRTRAAKLDQRERLIDAYIESYADWREGCAEVHTTYRRWALSEPRDRDLAFLAYRAALDREETAAFAYELIAEQVARGADH